MTQIWDNSTIEALRLCPTRWAWRYGVGLVPPRGEGVGDTTLTFGGAWHEAIAAMYKTIQGEQPYNTSPPRQQGLISLLKRRFSAVWSEDLAYGDRTEDTAHALLEAWFWKYFPPRGEIVLVEEPISISLRPGGLYVGKLDLLIREQDEYVVIDAKTTSQYINEKYWQQFAYSPQLIGYVVATEATTGVSVSKAVIDAVSVRPRSGGFGEQMERRSFWFYPTHKERWAEETLKWVDFVNERLPAQVRGRDLHTIQEHFRAQLLAGHDPTGAFPKSLSPPTCMAWFRECPYFSLCTAGWEGWRGYELTDWLPWEPKEESDEG